MEEDEYPIAMVRDTDNLVFTSGMFFEVLVTLICNCSILLKALVYYP